MRFEINTSLYEKLDRSFYERADVVAVARDLLGKYLVSKIDETLTVGKIVETEAYSGRNDKACHANNRRTPRTEVMYGRGGHSYVYLCYGIHHLFNVVTNVEEMADAVLVRALEPISGISEMELRRKGSDNLTKGPGVLTQAMGIKSSTTGLDLLGDSIWLCHGDNERLEIEVDTRIGVEYAMEDALKPWRFYVKGNKYVSKKKKARVD
ncbi:MAG: DNA-3-methyladenine glycosylase [Cyclobacteriaceae bacterium]